MACLFEKGTFWNSGAFEEFLSGLGLFAGFLEVEDFYCVGSAGDFELGV